MAGGEVHVGAPIGGAVLAAIPWLIQRGDERTRHAIAAARHRAAAPLVVAPAPLELDEAALRLAAAVHNLLFLAHPAAGEPHYRSARVRNVAAGAVALAALHRRATPTSTWRDTPCSTSCLRSRGATRGCASGPARASSAVRSRRAA